MKYIPIILSLLLLVGCAANPESASYRQISMEDAVKLMAEEEGYIILDVRRAYEFAVGHIPGAINVANEAIGTDEIPTLPPGLLPKRQPQQAGISETGRFRLHQYHGIRWN